MGKKLKKKKKTAQNFICKTYQELLKFEFRAQF